MRTLTLFQALACLLCSTIASFNSSAQEFPSKPIRMVVPFPPGGPGEVIARPVAEGLQAVIGQPVIVDFRPGAGAIPAVQAITSAPADGHTVLVGSTVLVLAKSLFRNLPYDPQRDLRAVIGLASSPYLVLVPASFPGSTVADLIGAAKAQPGKLNFASAGVGTQSHIAAELFNIMAETKITHVPYKGAGGAFPALMAGEVTVFFDNVFSAAGHVSGGRIKPIGVTSLARVEQYPALPTVDEQGLKGFESSAWFGIVVAKAVPDAIVVRLNEVFNKALQAATVRERYATLGVAQTGGTARAFQMHIDRELEVTGNVIRSAAITID
ncbi:MAG: Bug family tripartite tricarboxylate transporter substrate binding protein [Burkholderiales bacterium]